VKCVDYNIGRLLQTLSDKGIDDNTIIVFTSDHGDQLMEHGKLVST
jgi:arylsulfatase A-like enzyme